MKHILSIVRRVLLMLLLLACTLGALSCARGEIQGNPDVGKAYQRYVVSYKKNVKSIQMLPPYKSDYSASFYDAPTRYEIKDADTIARVAQILLSLEQYATLAEDQESIAYEIAMAEITAGACNACGVTLALDGITYFDVTVHEKVLEITSQDTTVYFTTEYSMKAELDELVAIAKEGIELTE